MIMNKNQSLFVLVGLALNFSRVVMCSYFPCQQIIASDKELVKFAMNFQFLSAELFLYAALGRGLDYFDPNLASGGPPPIGGRRAKLDPVDRRIVEEFGYQELGQLRYLKTEAEIARPLIDISKRAFARLVVKILKKRSLKPSFDAYANSLNFFLSVNSITYKGVVGLVGSCPYLRIRRYREACVELLGVKAGQNAVIRAYLYRRANDTVFPYNITVAKFVDRTSTFLNKLGKCGIKDEGFEVPRILRTKRRNKSNILAADVNSLSYSRTPEELLRIVYGTGNESVPGAFFPNGANGNIAKRFLKN